MTALRCGAAELLLLKMQATAIVASPKQTEIRIQGKDTNVPSICIRERTVIAVGKWLKVASVHDEFFIEGEIVPDPAEFVTELKHWNVKPDLFTFAQKISDPDSSIRIRFEMGGLRGHSYYHLQGLAEKWDQEGSQSEPLPCRAGGGVVRPVSYDDHFVKGSRICTTRP